MHYGHPPHVHTPEDLTLLHCFCGWTSLEISRSQLSERGIPWYCDDCGKSGLQYVHFHPRERDAAYRAFNVQDRLHVERPDIQSEDQETIDRIG